jgi:hypothetical protein
VVLEVCGAARAAKNLINSVGLNVMPQCYRGVAPRIKTANRGRSLQPGDVRQRHPTKEPLDNLMASKF